LAPHVAPAQPPERSNSRASAAPSRELEKGIHQ
jgi:hypothetical protein